MLGNQQRKTLDDFYTDHIAQGHKIVFNIGEYRRNFSRWYGNIHVSARGVHGIPVYIVAIDATGQRHSYWISTCEYDFSAQTKVEEIRKYLKDKQEMEDKE